MVGVLYIINEWMDKHKYINLPHMCGSVLIVYLTQIWHCLNYYTFDIKSLHIWLENFPAPSALTLYIFITFRLLLIFCWSIYILESVWQNRTGILIWNLQVNLGRTYISISGLLIYDYGASSSVNERAQVCQPLTAVLFSFAELCGPDCICSKTPELTLLIVIITS